MLLAVDCSIFFVNKPNDVPIAVIEGVNQCSKFVECVFNNSQSYHKCSAQLCNQGLIEHCNILCFRLHCSARRLVTIGKKYYFYFLIVDNSFLFPTVKYFSKSVNS